MIFVKKFLLFLLFFLVISFFAFYFVDNVSNPERISKLNTTVGTKNYELYLAKTSQEIEKGLARFDQIKNNEGMLFVFETPGTYSFWMKDMKFSIDIIFLNEEQKVINTFPNVKFESYQSPFDYETYKPDFPAKYVIELKEGEIKENGIKVGDRVELIFE